MTKASDPSSRHARPTRKTRGGSVLSQGGAFRKPYQGRKLVADQQPTDVTSRPQLPNSSTHLLRLALWVLRPPNPILYLILLPVALLAAYLIAKPPLTVALVMLGVGAVSITVLMAGVYGKVLLYYREICDDFGKDKAYELVTSVLGGLSEAVPAAIVAMGVGVAAVYYQTASSESEIELQDRQWHIDRTATLLEDLASFGYGSLAIITTAKERIVWINNLDAYKAGGGAAYADAKAKPPKPWVYQTDGLDRQATYAKYEELIREYAKVKSLDSILSGVRAHYSMDYAHHSENQQQIAAQIVLQADIVSDLLRQIEGYRLSSETAYLPTDAAQWLSLNSLARNCGKGIADLQQLIQYYIVDSKNWKQEADHET